MDRRYRNQLNKDQLRAQIAELRRELVITKNELAYSQLRLKSNPCDTALAASLERDLKSLVRCAINHEGVKRLALSMAIQMEDGE